MEGSLVVNEEMKNEERLPVVAMDSDDCPCLEPHEEAITGKRRGGKAI